MFLAKRVFLAKTLDMLGVAQIDPSVGVTAEVVALQDQLSAFFDEADATMEGFVSVATLASVLHRYWHWPPASR